MTKATWSRKVLGCVFASVLLLAPLGLGLTYHASTAAAATSLEEFLARLKKKKARQATDQQQQGGATTNYNHTPEIKSNGSRVDTVTEIVDGKNVMPMIVPDGAEKLRAAAERYRSIAASGGFPKVPRGTYKKGSTSKGIIALNKRLYLEGYLRVEATQGEYAGIFTSATEEAVRRFQSNMGLSVTGKTDGQTVDLLNVPLERRLRTIEANIARLEAYGENLGDRYVIVNVPAQQIETVSGGRVYSRHNAIVGRPSRPSPVVMTALSDINFNPYWNAPVSIVEQDIIPKLRSGNDILRDMNIRVFKGFGGPEIDPRDVNWRTAIPDDYHFRQEPGEGNAMATAKINFPSPFGIYLHDTPEKQLFQNSQRFYSSGCIRVQDMSLLVNWVLNGQDGIGDAEIATLAETLERRDVKLADPPQLRVVYLTAWPTTGGTVAFRNDVYELDGTGFTVGQPMPVGELSPDGQRFVLKPLPRLVAQVDDTGGGGLFGFRRKSNGASGSLQRGPKRPFFFGSRDDDPGSESIFSSSTSQVEVKKKATTTASTSSKSKFKPKKDTPGLFDWTAYRQEQAGTKSKKVVKKTAKKGEEEKLAKKTTGKKDEKKVAALDKDKTTAKKKPAEAADGSKKPAVKKPAECKPDKDGKLPKDCKTAAVKKPDIDDKKKAETASN